MGLGWNNKDCANMDCRQQCRTDGWGNHRYCDGVCGGDPDVSLTVLCRCFWIVMLGGDVHEVVWKSYCVIEAGHLADSIEKISIRCARALRRGKKGRIRARERDSLTSYLSNSMAEWVQK